MKVIDWLKESNRMSHLKAGFIIWIALMFVASCCLSCFDSILGITKMQEVAIAITCTVLSDAAVLIAMCSVEYIQKSSGIGKWDWIDVLAGCIFPIFASLFVFAFSMIY